MKLHSVPMALLCILLLAPSARAEAPEHTMNSAGRCFAVYDQISSQSRDEAMKSWSGSASGRVLGKAVQLWDPGYAKAMEVISIEDHNLLAGIAQGTTTLIDQMAACDIEWGAEFADISAPRPADFTDAAQANARAAERYRTDNALTCTIAYLRDDNNPDPERRKLVAEQAQIVGQAWARFNPGEMEVVRDELARQEFIRLENAFKAGTERPAELIAACDRTWASEFEASRAAKAEREAAAAEDAERERQRVAELRKDPDRCTRLEDRGIGLLDDEKNAYLDYVEQRDLSEYRFRKNNIARHLADLADEAEYADCRQQAGDFRMAVSKWNEEASLGNE